MRAADRVAGWALPAVLALFVLVPEIRRLVDWPLGFSALPVLSLVPLVFLAGLLFVVVRPSPTPRKLPVLFNVTVASWSLAFGFTLALALLSGGLFAPIYEAGLFILPMFAGLLIARFGDAQRDFATVRRTIAWLGAFVGAYGIVQWISPPPWDVAWVNGAGLSSIGSPVPYGLRVFSTLNSPGVCGDFLALALLTQLPALKPGRGFFWRICSCALMIGALALTFDRSAWLGLLIGIAAYVMLSPNRVAVGSVTGCIGLAVALLLANGEAIFGDSPVFALVNDRISTLDQIQSDDSYLQRQAETATALHESLTEPLGQGLGNIGTSTKLGEAGSTTVLDNGYLARFLEMGVFGVALYLLAIGTGLLGAAAAWLSARGSPDDQAIAAACFAVQLALAGLDVSSDHHNGISGLFFWIAVAVPALVGAKHAVARASAARVLALPAAT